MAEGELRQQVLLKFRHNAAIVRKDLSAIVQTPDGHLWLGSDELTTVERLSPVSLGEYGEHQQYAVGDYIDLKASKGEIDIEGIDFADGYLWMVGSHSKRRKGVKGKNVDKDIQRLLEVGADANRYLLARLPLVDGEPVQHDKKAGRTAACLAYTSRHNDLIKALLKDEHIGPFLQMGIPAKENGFDIEAIAVRGPHIFLGLRGPVLRGMAMVLEVQVKAHKDGKLTLKMLDNKKLYRKHFLDLNGLGIRDCCFAGDDLIILAGPTMTLSTRMQLFRFKDAIAHQHDTLWTQSSDRLISLFELPGPLTENAEGITYLPARMSAGDDLDAGPRLMVVYDSPDKLRLQQKGSILADVFPLSL